MKKGIHRGRAASLLQTRILHILWIGTTAADLERKYRELFGFDVSRNTIYTTTFLMRKRKWIMNDRHSDDRRQAIYTATDEGRRVWLDAKWKYALAAGISVRRPKTSPRNWLKV